MIHLFYQKQGFSVDYKMVGNQSDKKKFIGNSVVPVVVKKWAEAFGERLRDFPRTIYMQTYKKQKRA